MEKDYSENKKCYIWGNGVAFRRYLNQLPNQLKIDAVIDNDEKKWGETEIQIDGQKISCIAPKDLPEDAVVIIAIENPKTVLEIKNYLKQRSILFYHIYEVVDKKYAGIYQNFFKLVDAKCMDDNMEALADEVDVIFTATPQGLCASLVNEEILSKAKVIDLSADFRIKDVKKYEKWYGIEHKAPQFIDEAVYGLCEINREDIKKARLIANPGCYPTCSTLSIYPLLKEGLIDPNTIIIDAKSGTSGAGRGAKVPNLYCEVNENIKAYGVATHRHTPEIEDQLGYACGQEVLINFTPHLIPMNRGILVTAYASLKKEVSYEEVRAAYDKYYADETFIRVLDKDVCPQTKCVEGSNYVDVNFKIDLRTRRVIMMGAIDNLVKGAAGQAVQNMNLMFGFDEAEGLHQIPMLP